jgi:hypothetical protein
MSLPGFTADASLLKTTKPSSMRVDACDAKGVRLQQFDVSTLTSRGTSISRTPTVGKCIDTDYAPVCHSAHPASLRRCCDFTHERVCNGRRVAICTFTECTGFPDTNTSVLA